MSHSAPELVDIYKELARLLKLAQRQPDNANLATGILDLSIKISQAAQLQPDVIFSQLQFYKTALPYHVNLVFNQALLTLLLSLRNNCNETATQQLLCAAISQFATQGMALDDYFAHGTLERLSPKQLHQVNKPLLMHLQHFSCEIWRDAHASAPQRLTPKPLANQNRYLGQNKMQRILTLATYLGFLLTRNKRLAKMSFPQALQRVSMQLPSSDYGLIEGLLHYPSLFPPGAMLKLRDGRLALNLCRTKDKVLTRVYYPESNQYAADIEYIAHEQILSALAPQVLKKISLIDQWWNRDWHQECQGISDEKRVRPSLLHFRLDSPPPSLLAIQEELNQDEPDVEKITYLISQEKAFDDHLQNSASRSSRLNLNIKNTKHGLMMHGFGRTNSILMQQALLIRVSQHYSPLQEGLLQFTKLRGHVAATIAQSNKMWLPEEASCWACFASAGLFTSAELKGLNQWPQRDPDSDENGYDSHTLMALKKPIPMVAHATKLGQAWQQEKRLLQAIQLQTHLDKVGKNPGRTAQTAAMLGLSMLMSREIYFAHQRQKDDKQYLKQALPLLKLTEADIQDLKQEAIAQAHCYSPINH